MDEGADLLGKKSHSVRSNDVASVFNFTTNFTLVFSELSFLWLSGIIIYTDEFSGVCQ